MAENPLVSLRIEKHVLSGCIKNPQLVIDFDTFLNQNDFYVEQHKIIYSVMHKLVFAQKKVDKVMLAQKISELGITFKDDINIFDYIENLSLSQINDEGAVDAARELKNLRMKRDVCDTVDAIKALVYGSKEKSIEEIVAKADSLYNDKIRSFGCITQPIDIFKDMSEVIEERGNNPMEEIGFPTPYPEFNRFYGGLRNGNIYAVVSRPGQGKTSFVDQLCFGVSKISRFQVPALILDTEMYTGDIQFRMASALSGVPLWYLETGNWRRNPEMFDKVRAAMQEIKKNKYVFEHLHVGNRNTDEIIAIARRWYYTRVGRGKPAVIGYDYFKLTDEQIKGNWSEHQAVGKKIDDCKKRIAEELNIPLVSAMQLNRTGENQNRNSKDVVDDSSVIAVTDKLQWFASFIAIFRRKTLDEIEEDGEEFGTHKLIPTKVRFQGRDAAGHKDFMVKPTSEGKKKYVSNYVNYEVTNFDITEKGSLRDVIVKLDLRYDFEKKEKKKDSVLV